MTKPMNDLHETEFDSHVLAAATPVLVDFYAPWCGPCRMLAPLLETLAEHHAGRVRFVKINVDAAPALASRYQISAVPTLVLFHHGELLDSLVGMGSPNALKSRLDSLLASVPTAPANP